jgi:hypothetical protein
MPIRFTEVSAVPEVEWPDAVLKEVCGRGTYRGKSASPEESPDEDHETRALMRLELGPYVTPVNSASTLALSHHSPTLRGSVPYEPPVAGDRVLAGHGLLDPAEVPKRRMARGDEPKLAAAD